MLRRDRLIVAGALAVLTLLAWAYVLWLAVHGMPDMPAMDGAGMGAMPATVPKLMAWGLTEFALTFAMWAVMMVGMMTPSVAPMVLLYALVGRKAAAEGHPLAATGWFAGGYLATWILFALLASSAQWALTQGALLTPGMAMESRLIGGAVLLAAGFYQWTPLKDACLAQCQSPLHFIQRQGGFRREALGSLALGARHGAYCVGCCWALMGLLFVGGIMSLLVIGGLAVLVLLEKLVPAGRLVSRAAGAILVASSAYLVVTTLR